MAYVSGEGIISSIHNLDTTWRLVVSFTPRSLYAPPPPPQGERVSDAHCIGGWAGSRAGLEGFKYTQFVPTVEESKRDSSAVQPTALSLH